MKTYLRYDNQTRTETDETVIATLVRKGWEIYTPEPEPVIPPTYTAEDHLAAQGYTPLRLLTCLDLEGKLRATEKASTKLAAVRQWLDNLTLAAAVNPDEARSDWSAAPHPFDQVLSESLAILATP